MAAFASGAGLASTFAAGRDDGESTRCSASATAFFGTSVSPAGGAPLPCADAASGFVSDFASGAASDFASAFASVFASGFASAFASGFASGFP